MSAAKPPLPAGVAQKLGGLSPEKRAQLEQAIMRRAQAAVQEASIPRRKPSDPPMLSYCQQRLWFLEALTPGTATYNVPIALRLRGRLDRAALQRALDTIVERHEVLRTYFDTRDGEAFPLVKPAPGGDWSIFRFVEFDGEPGPDRQARIETFLYEESGRPFDVTRDHMLRAVLVECGPDDHILLLVAHHIAWDAISKIVAFREMAALYDAWSAGQTPELAALPIQYADYALWYRRWLDGGALAKQEAYWRTKLEGAPAKLNLKTDFPRPANQTFAGAKRLFELSPLLVERARALSRGEGGTLYMTLLASFHVFLLAQTGQEDQLVASPIAGRDHVQTENLIGFFINTMILRTKLEPALAFTEILKRVKDTALGAYAHHDTPFHKLVEIAAPPRDLSRMPLTQVNFRVQNDPTPVPALRGLEVEALPLIDNSTSKFDMALELAVTPGSSGYFEYNTRLFQPETVERWVADYTALLAELLDRPRDPVSALAAFETIRGRAQQAATVPAIRPRARR